MTDQPVSIAYLGPAGTYCHEAARFFADKLDAPQAELVPFPSFGDVFDAVDRGRCTYGVVGKENSIEGPVTATLDNFAFRSSAVILAEKIMDIHHCLILHPDAALEDIQVVASHTQGIAQCRRFLAENLPGRTTLTVSSTAESARLAAQDIHTAGIANALAAEIHGGRVAQKGIEDHFGNQTAFALIGRPGMTTPLMAAPGNAMKTSLALFMQEDRAGTLQMILSEFAFANINLTMIQSRPTKQQLGDYIFFIEFPGSTNDVAVQTALNCLRMKLREVKVLGSYPVE